MFNQENENFTNTTVWQNLDFKTVKQRLNLITDQLESALVKSCTLEKTNYIYPEDQAKLLKFMEVNDLSEAQAIALIINAFFKDKPSTLINPPSLLNQTLERIAALEQQVAELAKERPETANTYCIGNSHLLPDDSSCALNNDQR